MVIERMGIDYSLLTQSTRQVVTILYCNKGNFRLGISKKFLARTVSLSIGIDYLEKL